MAATLTNLQVATECSCAALAERTQHLLLFRGDDVLLLQLCGMRANDLSHFEAVVSVKLV